MPKNPLSLFLKVEVLSEGEHLDTLRLTRITAHRAAAGIGG
jgi:hypothetical protein